MFVSFGNRLYVTNPSDTGALALLESQRSSKLLPRYLVPIFTFAGTFILAGLLAGALGLFFTPETARNRLGGLAALAICFAGGFVVGRLMMSPMQGAQDQMLEKYVRTRRILRLPPDFVELLLEQLALHHCANFLPHYRPNPSDTSELRNIVEEAHRGSAGLERLEQAAKDLAGKVSAAQKEQEEADRLKAEALRDLRKVWPWDSGS